MLAGSIIVADANWFLLVYIAPSIKLWTLRLQMVLGLKLKHRKGAAVKLDYIVHVREIRPWPPSDSLRSVQTVLLKWENGDQNSGSLLSVAVDLSIRFDESFRLPLALKRDKNDMFRKNYLEFSLFEPHKDKAEGHILGTSVINLADYVLSGKMVSVNAPIKLKRNSNDWQQTALSITLEPVDRDNSNSSTAFSLSKETSLDKDDTEYASCTDEDTSSHSSRRSSTFEYALSSSPQNEKLGMQNGHGNSRTEPAERINNKVLSSIADGSGDPWKKAANNTYVSSSNISERSMSFVQRNSVASSAKSAYTSMSFREADGKANSLMSSSMLKVAAHNVIANKHRYREGIQQTAEEEPLKRFDTFLGHEDDKDGRIYSNSLALPDFHTGSLEKKAEQKDFESDISPLSLKKELALPPDQKGQWKPANSAQLDILEGFLSPQTKGAERKEPNDCSRNEWKARVEMLEDELREAAAVELAVYSTISEHSSSGNKVHSPARRLSRFYCSAYGDGSRAKRARAAVSGLILVSRACGNDVPRLTFWLSNAIMLRALISQNAAEVPHSTEEGKKSKSFEECDDWEDTLTFIIALENVESWLFSRIVESIWWQTFTPHMQPAVVKHGIISTDTGATKSSGRRNKSGCHDLGSFSIELWKKAFKDSCERLCPIRASGHECGCLASLVVLVMEQLVNRLDVAMFNAILRESGEEMPTDPVSDPISDPHVLPIQTGKSSFTAGAQLKNVIGNWSRWLSDLFGLEDTLSEDGVISRDGIERPSFKAFRLLHALSDLMMLPPFEMLADASTRKEVCPLLGPAAIRRVLNNFVPDEFCPNPIPRYIIDALDSEETLDSMEMKGTVASIPWRANRTRYSPPPAALMTCVGEVGSQVLKTSRLSTLKKSHISDDELDELDSPLTSIIPDSSSSSLQKLSSMPQQRHGRNVLRYKLLRQVWKDDDNNNNNNN